MENNFDDFEEGNEFLKNLGTSIKDAIANGYATVTEKVTPEDARDVTGLGLICVAMVAIAKSFFRK